eukprot:11211334-Heterocapsa_arctica.AAC.1
MLTEDPRCAVSQSLDGAANWRTLLAPSGTLCGYAYGGSAARGLICHYQLSTHVCGSVLVALPCVLTFASQ